jgi:hypothetical protein
MAWTIIQASGRFALVLESQIIGSAALFLLALLSWAGHEEPRLLRSFYLLAITPFSLGVLGVMWFMWSAPYAFAWELIRRATDVTIHSSFSTSYTAICWEILIFLWLLWRVYSREGGFAAVLTHWGNVRDAIGAIVVAYLLTFLFHLFSTIPREIYTTAKDEQPPGVIKPIEPPPSAYYKTNSPKGHETEQQDFFPPSEPMFSEAKDRFNIVAGGISTTLGNGQLNYLVGSPAGSPIKEYVENNKFFVDAILFQSPGFGSVELKKNVLHKNIPDWDRCFNATTLEVVDDKLTPVFQMIYTTPNDIVINGIFRLQDTAFIFSPKGFSSQSADQPITALEYSVKRIFKYPTRTYHCKTLEVSASQTETPKTGPYRTLTNAELCNVTTTESARIYAMADQCLRNLENSRSNGKRNQFRRRFSDEFMKCCSQTAKDIHEELIFRLRPAVQSRNELLFHEVDWENQTNPTVPQMRTVCGLLTQRLMTKMAQKHLSRRVSQR